MPITDRRLLHRYLRPFWPETCYNLKAPVIAGPWRRLQLHRTSLEERVDIVLASLQNLPLPAHLRKVPAQTQAISSSKSLSFVASCEA